MVCGSVGTVTTRRPDGGFELEELAGTQLTAIRLEGTVDLLFGEDRGLKLQIERDFVIRRAATDEETTVEFRPYEAPWNPLGMNELVSLFRSQVLGAAAEPDATDHLRER
jgi:hypothetical protein